MGAIIAFPPFSSLFQLNEQAKRSWVTVGSSGDAPFGHAELATIDVLCQRLGLDPKRAIRRLREAKIAVTDGQQTLRELAQAHRKRPSELFDVLRGDDPILFGNGRSGRGRGMRRRRAADGHGRVARSTGRGRGLGRGLRRGGGGQGQSAPGQGIGRMTLAEACQSAGVTPAQGRRALAALGIEAKPNEGMRQLSAAAGMRPGQLLRRITAAR